MKPGQLLTKWWQDYVAGRLRSPQAICAAARAENPDTAQASDRFFSMPDEDGADLPPVPQRLRAPNWFSTDNYLRQTERADYAHCDRRLVVWAAHFTEAARKRAVPLYVHTALRSEAEQTKVLRSGNSKAPYPTSAHNIGEAVDIVHGVFHWDMLKDEWLWLHALGRLSLDRINAQLPKAEKLSLDWGGSWSFYDPAHWEIKDYRQRIRRLPPSPSVHMTPRHILSTHGRF